MEQGPLGDATAKVRYVADTTKRKFATSFRRARRSVEQGPLGDATAKVRYVADTTKRKFATSFRRARRSAEQGPLRGCDRGGGLAADALCLRFADVGSEAGRRSAEQGLLRGCDREGGRREKFNSRDFRLKTRAVVISRFAIQVDRGL